jgi:hypothetical protein
MNQVKKVFAAAAVLPAATLTLISTVARPIPTWRGNGAALPCETLQERVPKPEGQWK